MKWDKLSIDKLNIIVEQKGVDDVSDDDEWEPVEPITSPCDSVLGYSELSCKKQV